MKKEIVSTREAKIDIPETDSIEKNIQTFKTKPKKKHFENRFGIDSK